MADSAVIVRGVGGHYTLHRHDPPFQGLAYLRGILRQEDIRPLVGDRVEYTSSQDPDIPFVVEKILPRKNVSVRPAVANIDSLIITVSIFEPRPDYLLIDRLIVYARKNHMEPLILITKTDLAKRRAAKRSSEQLLENYADAEAAIYEAGFGEADADLQRFKSHLAGKTVAFAGQSGVGKSTKLNEMFGELSETGAVSEKIGRGRHTTRETTLYPIEGGGYVADTPGFSVLNLADLDITWRDLREGYAEFEKASEPCRFEDCRHDGDMGCKIDEMTIHPERLARYRILLQETDF